VLLKIYLLIYFALIAGAIVVLERGGVLRRVPAAPAIAAVVIAVTLGTLAALTGRRR